MRKRSDGLIPPQGGTGVAPARPDPPPLPPKAELRTTMVGKAGSLGDLVALLAHCVAVNPDLACLPWTGTLDETLTVRDWDGNQVLEVTCADQVEYPR